MVSLYWVYVDAKEREKVFNAAFARVIAGSGLPGAPPAATGSSASYESALTPMDEDERPPPLSKRSEYRSEASYQR